jgi:GTP pyrophosphokinase
MARKALLRQLLAWERDFVGHGNLGGTDADDRIYVFTPAASVIELPAGATPIDFAYAVHTDLGHRCRGAKLDGAMVPLNTALVNGQTVEIIAAKDGGPSLDWLNGELGYLKSPRSKAKARAWFNTLAQHQTIARGREQVEKLLQREGKTATKLDDLAARLGFRSADALFEVVGKDEFSIRNIETLLRPVEAAPSHDDTVALKRPQSESRAARGGVLVVGVESLLTSLARCCRPAPPDPIGGYVTRGNGVAIHRLRCSNYRQMLARSAQRTIPVAWGAVKDDATSAYPIDVMVEATDRHGLLRDISEVFAKDKMNVVRVHSETAKSRGSAWMTFTIEVPSASGLPSVLAQVAKVAGVRIVRRK